MAKKITDKEEIERRETVVKGRKSSVENQCGQRRR